MGSMEQVALDCQGEVCERAESAHSGWICRSLVRPRAIDIFPVRSCGLPFASCALACVFGVLIILPRPQDRGTAPRARRGAWGNYARLIWRLKCTLDGRRTLKMKRLIALAVFLGASAAVLQPLMAFDQVVVVRTHHYHRRHHRAVVVVRP